jgi:hypothetical protein
MRSAAALVAAAVLAGSPAFAEGVAVGVKGGANLATVRFTGEPDATTGRWSGVLGAFAVMPVYRRLWLQPEVLYTRKGARLRGTGPQPSLLLDYLEVPVLARVSTRLLGTKVYLVGGPAPAIRARAKTRTQFSGAAEEIDVADELQRFDLGVVGGAGMEIGSLVVEGRYTFGLIDIDKDSADAARAANRVLSVTAGWRF